MYEKLVSVIMSTYNESYQEISFSVWSILEQTYINLELIVVIDNPENTEVSSFLSTIDDQRVTVLYNNQNIGLVGSLNKALFHAHGEVIVRMDADDIAIKNRIEMQLKYMTEHKLDMIGCDIQTIDKNNLILLEKVHFPTFESKLRICIPYGNCMPHPTWMVKKKVYDQLNGYRLVPNCEDYDFILRVMESKQYRMGNMPEVGVMYRIRENSVSQINVVDQYILRNYLSKNRRSISEISEKEIMSYIESDDFENEKKTYMEFLNIKQKIKKDLTMTNIITLIVSRYFYQYLVEKVFYFWRSI